jgi:alpha-galactosidase
MGEQDAGERWSARGGPPEDPTWVALEVVGEDGILRWYGEGGAPAGAGPAPAVPQRWGARLDVQPEPTLHPGGGAGEGAAPGLEFLRGDGRWRFRPQRAALTSREDAVEATARLQRADPGAGLLLETELRLDRASGALRLESQLENAAATAVEVRWLAVAALPLPFWVDHVVEPVGDWCGEFRTVAAPLPASSFLREVREGRSSHARPPYLLLCEGPPRPDAGRVLALSLAWSGDHRIRIDRLPDGRAVLQAGVLLHPGEGTLAAGERLATPALWLAASARGVDGVAARLHDVVRRRILPRPASRRPRPVHLNTWEALYFDHDPERLRRLAEAAAAVGVERFVLDDGWFRNRTDDGRALGDWAPDPARYPEGLGPLVAQVRDLGLEFGLWVEPEMVSEDSDLARAHPEWLRGDATGHGVTGRRQRVLDLSRPEVVEHLFAVLDGLLRAHPIAYLKWDHNRVLTEDAADGTAGHLAQARALETLLGRLRTAHPEVELESCASGGGRADWGVLAHARRLWTSDANDPVVRARIMAGVAPFLPPEVTGVHVGPATAHVTGRSTNLDFRGAVALLGHFGLELDLLALDDGERARLAAHVERYKRLRPVLHGGASFTPHEDDDHQVRVFVTADRRRAVVVVLRLDDRVPGAPVRFRVPGLAPDVPYRVVLAEPLPEREARPGALVGSGPWQPPGTVVAGGVLAGAGLVLQLPAPQQAVVLELTAE